MRISTEITSSLRFLGFEKAVEAVAKAGFDCWDFGVHNFQLFDWKKKEFNEPSPDFTVEFARKLKKIGLDNGIECNQAHSLFPVKYNDGKMLPAVLKSIEVAAEAGAKIIVIHPDNDANIEQNAEYYARLLPTAHACGIKIATENMFNWDKENNISRPAALAKGEEFRALIDYVADPYLVACFDIGHAEMVPAGGGAVKMINELGKRIEALHIHDNNKHNDNHEMPFTMNIDFAPIGKALKEIGYSGDLTLEADAYLRKHSADDIEGGLKKLAESARKFEKLVI